MKYIVVDVRGLSIERRTHMRAKEACYVISFHTTADAIAFEKKAGETGFPGRLIPLPRAISAGCGMAWKLTKKEAPEQMQVLLASFAIEYEDLHELHL